MDLIYIFSGIRCSSTFFGEMLFCNILLALVALSAWVLPVILLTLKCERARRVTFWGILGIHGGLNLLLSVGILAAVVMKYLGSSATTALLAKQSLENAALLAGSSWATFLFLTMWLGIFYGLGSCSQTKARSC